MSCSLLNYEDLMFFNPAINLAINPSGISMNVTPSELSKKNVSASFNSINLKRSNKAAAAINFPYFDISTFSFFSYYVLK